MRAHFVVLPQSKMRALAGKLGERYANKFPHYFVVDNKKLIPHITLFNLEFNKRDYSKMVGAAKSFLKNKKALVLEVSRHSYYDVLGGGWTGLKIKPTKSLVSLRRSLLSTLKRYGKKSYRLKGFSPHITLTKFKKRSDGKHATFGSKVSGLKFKADEIVIGHDLKFWQIDKFLQTFKLK